MIDNISAAGSTPAAPEVQPRTPAPAVPAAAPRQDSVHLSPQALAAARGDVDRDGDSH
jgi:type II secretory pathway component HofQ